MLINKRITLAFIFLILFIVVPVSFAADDLSANMTDSDVLEIDETDSALSYNNEDEILTAGNDYYFNASLDNDNGDGSIANPYKYLKADRIMGNSNIHLAEGEYRLDTQKAIDQVNIIGSDSSKTIIRYNGVAFKVNHYLTLTNVTLMGLSIRNQGTVNVTNSVFNAGYGSTTDGYGNNFGGAIFTDDSNTDSQVNIINSTFTDNYAVYGGAIYMGAGCLNVEGCEFTENTALNYGGAIACENAVNITISKSRFVKNTASNDAGGAIYIKNADSFIADNLEIIGSKATFGGALTTLNVDVVLSHVNASDNFATWDGGAVYHMYGEFKSTNGNFINNTARNGGALFIDNSTSLFIRDNSFENNTALVSAGAIYSILNNLQGTVNLRYSNTFKNNSASTYDDVYETDLLNLTIGNGNYSLFKVNDTIISELPSRYSLVEQGFVTSVKNQQASGNCWAFTAMAVLESCIKKITGREFDLSEENMKNVIARFSDYGWKIETNEGGYDYMPWGYLTSWLGPVLESDDYFEDHSVLSPILNSIVHIQNILFLKRDNFTANDEIKAAIMKYGAVGTSIYMDNNYLNNGKDYYCWNAYSSNHAVTIVGWDDNYSRDNFRYGSYADGDGAWIVKNSWGPYWGDNGYFYVSYYDASFAKVGVEGCAYTFILNDTIRFDKNYQYDIAGRTDYLYSGNPKVWYKNKFTATSNEELMGVSTYFGKLTDWTVSIYVNNVLKSTKSGTSNPGYYTINLDEGILLSIGDTFEVVFNTTSDGVSMVPVSEYVSLNKLTYLEGISFISFDGKNWNDLFNLSMSYSTHSYKSQVACIKAFTVLEDFNTTISLDISSNINPVTITATVVDQYGNLVNSGVVTFLIDDESVTVNVLHGIASLTRNFDEGIHNVRAVFNGASYISSSSGTSFEVSKENITLEVSMLKYQNNVTLTITSSKSISKKLLILVNGEEHTGKLHDGSLIFKLTDLDNGKYDVSVSLYSNDVYNSNVVNLSFTVDVKKTSILAYDLLTTDYSGDSYSVVLVDGDNRPIANKTIVFHLNDDKIHAVTDSEGRASMAVNLAGGNYDVTASFNDEDGYYGSSNSSEIRVKTKVDINLGSATYQNNVLINISLSKPVNATLTLSINGENQTVNITDGLGAVSLTGLDNGNYTVVAYLDESYQYSSDVLEINMDVKDTQIIAQSLVTSDENFNYAVTLLDEDGNPLEGKEIEFILNGATYHGITDNCGNANATLALFKGINQVNVSFNGDERLFKSAGQSQITLKPIVTARIIASNVVDVSYIEVQFSKPINQTAIIWLDGQSNTVSIRNGQGFISKSGLERGIHNVTVELLSDEYNFTKISGNFEVTIRKTQILAYDFMTSDYSSDSYTVRLIDEDGNPIANENIWFILNDGTIFIVPTNGAGQASFAVNLPFGNYTVTSRFSPSSPDTVNDYYGCENASKITVKIKVSANVNVDRTLRDVKINIAFTKAINDIISVSLNGESRSVRITDGKGVLSLDNLENGDYSIRVNLDESKYISSPVECSFNVNVKDTQIFAGNFKTYFASGELYSLKLVDEDGLPIKSALVKLVFDGVETDIVRTGDDGTVTIPIVLKNGIHTLLIRFEGDNDHVSSQAAVDITVKSSIVFTNDQYALNSNCVVLLYGDVEYMEVTFSIDNVQHVTIAKNGRISININLKNGMHTIKVINPETGEIQSKTIKVGPRLTGNNNIEMYYGANKAYSVKVYGNNGKVVGAGQAVTFSIGGKTYSVKTDKNGWASVKLNQLKAKTYTVTAIYKGYKVSNKITVKPTLITKNKSAKKGKTVKFTAKLLNTNGKVLKGKKITFKIKSKKYTAKTNKKGIATIKIKKLKVGKHKITTKYGKIKNINKIKIKK